MHAHLLELVAEDCTEVLKPNAAARAQIALRTGTWGGHGKDGCLGSVTDIEHSDVDVGNHITVDRALMTAVITDAIGGTPGPWSSV